mgnify:CR=1 FL=1
MITPIEHRTARKVKGHCKKSVKRGPAGGLHGAAGAAYFLPRQRVIDGGQGMPRGAATWFGPELHDDGVRFRLWAPRGEHVALLVGAGDAAEYTMTPTGDGWFSCFVPGAGHGTRYRFRVDGGPAVPDPASRRQADDVHDASVVVAPDRYRWAHGGWRGRPWHEAVFAEVHVGTATPEGTFEGLRQRLDHYVKLGVTAIELMPVADFPGRRNWGYDGVLPFAPDAAYGTPGDLKRLVDTAHGLGLMVFLDVVYNHFGPDGNYLHLYAGDFFTDRFDTPWGWAINFARPEVRQYYVENVLHWLETYNLDGLRLDAVHAIFDDSGTHILNEIARAVHDRPGDRRHVHLVLENDDNAAGFLGDGGDRYRAQWNDDFHHAAHAVATGETFGYYQDYAADPVGDLGRALAEGFVYQGEYSPFRGRPRGDSTAGLPPTRFVNFLQNHDQVGNRAFGERLSVLCPPERVHALQTVLLLAPQPPLLFMGEEWFCKRPFRFFCDFHDELADAVRQGRRREFADFPGFQDEAARAAIPDPNAQQTFDESHPDWAALKDPAHAAWRDAVSRLLSLRHRVIVPLIERLDGAARVERPDDRALRVTWPVQGGGDLVLLFNAADGPAGPVERPAGTLLTATRAGTEAALARGRLPEWTAAWFCPEPYT